MAVVRTIRNPKLDLVAEIHRHQLTAPPQGTPATRFYATLNGVRPADSHMRDTEDEAARDAADAIGLPKDWEDRESAAARGRAAAAAAAAEAEAAKQLADARAAAGASTPPA